MMRHVCCNYCGQDDPESVNQGPDLYLNRSGNFRLVRCRNCDLIYQNPQLTSEELLQHYPTEQYELYAPALGEGASALQRAARQGGIARRYQRIMNYVEQPGSILDIGCATGAFLDFMRSRSWRVTGVELNPAVAQYAREKLALDVHTGTLEQAELQNELFDVVTMWDVFEHVLDPRATLAEVARVLKPGGLLVLSLPNPNSLEARLFKAAWAGWDRPRHLHIFTPVVLRRYLQEAGFEKTHIESIGGRLRVTLLSISYLCNARGISPERWKPWLSGLYNLPLRLLTWPLYRVAETLNQTTTMTVFTVLEKETARERA